MSFLGHCHHHPGNAWRLVKKLQQPSMVAPACCTSVIATFSSNADEGSSSSGFFSWVDKIKGAFKGKTSDAATQPSQHAQSSESALTLLSFADQIKRVRKLQGFAQLVKSNPHVDESAATLALERQEMIIRAIASHDPTGKHLDAKEKAKVAVQCSCTEKDVSEALANYECMKQTYSKVLKMKDEGKPLPKTLEEVKNLIDYPVKHDVSQGLSKSAEIGRNSPCHCGSGKKYKRCCGRTS